MTVIYIIYWRPILRVKEHILAALREHFERWEQLLASLSEMQVTA